MEQALFDDPICILLLRCFCWPGSERYRQAAALSGQQATLGFSLSPLFARRMAECLSVPLWNELARCCTVNAILRDNRLQLGVLLSCGASIEDTEVKRHGLPQEHCVCHYLVACLLVLWDILVRRKGNVTWLWILGVVPFAYTNRWCPVLLKVVFYSGLNSSDTRTRRAVPVGKCSLTGQLSTCRVALPPFLVNRTRWYLPSFIAVVVSFTLMSTVPMLNVTPTLPCSWKRHKEELRADSRRYNSWVTWNASFLLIPRGKKWNLNSYCANVPPIVVQ